MRTRGGRGGTCGMLGVCVRFSAALGREIVLAYTAPSLAASCCLHRVLLVMLCASAASCQLKRLCWLRCLRKRMVPISTWRASGSSWDGNGIGGSVPAFRGDSQSASAKRPTDLLQEGRWISSGRKQVAQSLRLARHQKVAPLSGTPIGVFEDKTGWHTGGSGH